MKTRRSERSKTWSVYLSFYSKKIFIYVYTKISGCSCSLVLWGMGGVVLTRVARMKVAVRRCPSCPSALLCSAPIFQVRVAGSCWAGLGWPHQSPCHPDLIFTGTPRRQPVLSLCRAVSTYSICYQLTH